MFPLIPPRDEPPEPDTDDDAEDFSDEREPTWEEELEAAGSPDDLIVLNTYRYAHEAELAKTQLEEKGITANVADNDLLLDFLGNLVRDAKLLVLRSQARQAVAILTEQPSPPVSEDEASEAITVRGRFAQMDPKIRHAVTANPPAPENSEIDEAPEIVQCLACGAVLADNQARCPACGWSYRDDGEDEQPWAITVR